MHRKFIALIVSAAIAVTAFGATPARAGDTERLLGGLAALAIIGAAIHHHEKKSRNRTRVTATPPKPTIQSMRPLPPRVARYDLPRHCLRQPSARRAAAPLLGNRCLNRHYRYAASLPRVCRVSYWNGREKRHGFEPICLRQKGYRVVNYR